MAAAKTEGDDPDDPTYRVAYDVDRDKIGCVLIQALLGGDLPRDLFLVHFGTETWTLDADACSVYPIRLSQIPLLADRASRE